MKQISKWFALGCCTLLIGCGDKETPPKKVDIDNNSSGNPLTAPVDYLGAVNKAKKTAVKVLDVASVTQAIQTFHANEDRYPIGLIHLGRREQAGCGAYVK